MMLTEMFRTIPSEEKHDKLKALIEEHNVGNDEDYQTTLKGLLENEETDQNTLKSKLIKIISPNVNEVHSDEENVAQEEVETVHYDEDVVHADREVTINNMGSTKDFLESYL